MATPNCLLVPLPAWRTAPAVARILTKPHLHSWGYTHISDDALSVASELTANAVAATPGREIRYQCSHDTAGVLIAVWDESLAIPRPRPVPDLTLETLDISEEHWDDNGGRGLPLVAALAIEYGHTLDPTGGKWVWARLKP